MKKFAANSPLGLAAFLALVTLIVFWPVTNCGFTNFDDVRQNGLQTGDAQKVDQVADGGAQRVLYDEIAQVQKNGTSKEKDSGMVAARKAVKPVPEPPANSGSPIIYGGESLAHWLAVYWRKLHLPQEELEQGTAGSGPQRVPMSFRNGGRKPEVHARNPIRPVRRTDRAGG